MNDINTMSMEEILTTKPIEADTMTAKEEAEGFVDKLTYNETNPLQEALIKQRQEEFKTSAKDRLKKENLYNDDNEKLAAILERDGIEFPEELTSYQETKKQALEVQAEEFNKSLKEDVAALDSGIEQPFILPGASVGFNLGEVAFETAYTGIMDVVPEDIKEKAPTLTSLGVIGGIILATPQLRKGAKNLLEEGGNKLDELTSVDLAEAIKNSDIDPAKADEMLSSVNPNVQNIDEVNVAETSLEDVLVKHEKFIEEDLTKELDSITDDDINRIFGTPETQVKQTVLEVPKIDVDNIKLKQTEEEIKASKLQEKAQAIEDELTKLETEVGVSVSISNRVDEVEVSIPKTETDILVENLATYNLTKNPYSGGRAAARSLLNKTKAIVREVGYDKHINKWIQDGDIEAAYLRAEELRANKSTNGIQRPGTDDYKPLSNEFIYAQAAPEIAGGILGAGTAAQQEGATAEDIAIGFLLGAGATHGGKKYLLRNSVKVTTDGKGNAKATMTEEVTTDRLTTLRAARLEELDGIIANIADDIKFAGDIRAAKLTETLEVLEKVKTTLSNTDSFTMLTKRIKDTTIRDMVQKATKTTVNVDPKKAEDILKTKATIEMKEGKVTAINLNRIESEQDIETAFGTIEELYRTEFKKKSKSFDEIRAEANQLGFDINELNKLYKDSDEMAAKITAARDLATTIGEEFIKISNRIDEAKAMGKSVDELYIELQNTGAKFAAVTSMVEKSKGNLARATSAMRMTARTGEFELVPAMEIFNALGSGSRAGLDKLAKKIAGKKSLEAHDHLAIKGTLQPNGFNMIEEFYLNALLSNPSTHLKNAASNVFTGVHSILNKYAEAGMGMFAKDGVTFREANAYAGGYIMAIKEAWKISAMSAKKGEPIIDWIQKEEGMQYQAISQETLPGLGAFGKVLGGTVNTPFKALMVSDEFFKALAYRAEFNASAVKHAYKEIDEGITQSNDLGKRIAEIQSTPISDVVEATMNNTLEGSMKAMHRESLENARFLTHTKQLGEIGQGIQKVHQIPLLGKILFPFIRTPINIMKYIGKHTPVVNALSNSERAAWAAGGRSRAKVNARLATGSALYATGWSLASSGVVTGNLSDDPGVVESMKAAGIQPNSIKIGNYYVPYQGADVPFNFFKISADINDILQQADGRDQEVLEEMADIAAAVTLAFGKMAENSTWMESLGQIISLAEAPRDPNTPTSEKLRVYAENKLASLVPSVIYGLAREQQDAMVEVGGLVDKLKKKIPFYENGLPVQYDMYGKAKEHTSGLIPRATTESLDPVKKEIARMKYKASWVPRKIKNVKLEPEVRSFIARTKGEYFYSYSSQLINGGSWEDFEDGTPQIKGSKHIMLDRMDKMAKELAILEAREKFEDFDVALTQQEEKIMNTRWGE